MLLGRGTVIRPFGSVYLEEDSVLELGAGVAIMQGAEIIVTRGAHLRVAPGVYIGAYCCNIRSAGSIEIEAEARVAQFVSLIDANYAFRKRTVPAGESIPSAVTIGRGAWVGAHTVVLPNVVSGEGAVVAAASVITDNVPAFAIVDGNPARLVGYPG